MIEVKNHGGSIMTHQQLAEKLAQDFENYSDERKALVALLERIFELQCRVKLTAPPYGNPFMPINIEFFDVRWWNFSKRAHLKKKVRRFTIDPSLFCRTSIHVRSIHVIHDFKRNVLGFKKSKFRSGFRILITLETHGYETNKSLFGESGYKENEVVWSGTRLKKFVARFKT